ncbi:MAG: hypothetical protein ACE5OR_06005 [bacterium]
MFTIEIEDRKESLLYAIALGCVLLLAIGVTLVYWTHRNTLGPEMVEMGISGAASRAIRGGQEPAAVGREDAATEKTAPNSPAGEDNGTISLWFFVTLISALLIVLGLTFRYYSHREMKAAERRWEKACEQFLARTGIEGTRSDREGIADDNIWLRILRAER